MRGVGGWVGRLSALGLAGFVSACAGAPHDASLPIYDPNEQFNRGVLHLNQVVLDPPATVVKSVPGAIRDRLQDLDANLKEPRVLGNNILQGRFNAAAITVGRIIFNTTFGLGGLFDVASQGGLPQQTGDFGQTMFVWGVPAGAYTVSPYFRSLDATRFHRRNRGYGRRSCRLGRGWDDLWMAVVDWVGRPLRCRSSRPVETGREFIGRFLQLPALELLSDAPGAIARGGRPAPADRIAGHPGRGRRSRSGSPSYTIPPPQ